MEELAEASHESPKKKNNSIRYAIDLMIKLVIQDLKYAPDRFKTYEFLKHFDSSHDQTYYPSMSIYSHDEESNFMQFLIIIKLLNFFCKNPKVSQESSQGDGTIPINLNKIISNLDLLIPYNPFVILKSLKLINSMAFKNSMEIRRQMKHLKMFELRDKLIIQHLTNVSEILLHYGGNQIEMEDLHQLGCDGKRFLLKSVSEFSYDVLAAKTEFKESRCPQIICLTLLYYL